MNQESNLTRAAVALAVLSVCGATASAQPSSSSTKTTAEFIYELIFADLPGARPLNGEPRTTARVPKEREPAGAVTTRFGPVGVSPGRRVKRERTARSRR